MEASTSPATCQQVSQPRKQASLFRPYCGAAAGAERLEDAMAMFQSGEFRGARRIEDGQPIPFSLQWRPGQLPVDPCPCTLTIDPVPGACYRFSVPCYQAVLWLLEACRSGGRHPTGEPAPDLPRTFWAQLFAT